MSGGGEPGALVPGGLVAGELQPGSVTDALAVALEMAPLPADDPKFFEAAVQAMDIYWRDVIDIPVVQFLHRIPYNQTYWTNWPTTENLARGTNGAFWAHTGLLVVSALKKA